MTIGIMSIASAALPASAEKCFCDATIQVQAKTPTTIEGVPFSTSDTKRVTKASREAGILGAVDPAADAERKPDQAGGADDHQRADDGVQHAAAVFAGGHRALGEEGQVEAAGPLGHERAEDQEQRQHGQHHREPHQADHDVAAQAARRGPVHAVPPPPPRATRQMSSRAAALIRTVTTKSVNAT